VRGPAFRCEPVEESFFETAPLRLQDVIEIPLPGERVWDELTADDALHWCRLVGSLRWTSPRPFAAGTTRTVTSLRGLQRLEERFFRWEEGRRQSFYVYEASTPMFRRFAEDYLVEPASDNSCRFTWTVAAEPRAAARGPVNGMLIRTLFKDTRKHYGVT
jgi:hypothetical protein